MIAATRFHNSVACITGNIVNVSSDVYIDSVKPGRSDIVSEEIEITCDTRLSAAGEINKKFCLLNDGVAPFSPLNMTRQVERSQNLPDDSLLEVSPVPLLESVLSGANSARASANGFLNKNSRVIRKILYLRPNEDTEVAKAKVLQDLITSFEKKAATEVEKRVVLAKETIVELVIVKAPIRQKPKTVVTDRTLVDLKMPLLGNGFSHGLDTAPISMLRSNCCRTPCHTERETCFPSEIIDVEHENCYFDSQALSLRHTSLDRNKLKSAESPAMNWSDGFHNLDTKSIVQDTRKSLDGDSGISVTSNSCSGKNAADFELSEEATSAKSMFDASEKQINPMHPVVKDQIYSCLNMHPGKDNQRMEAERRPPFSYSQLIKMALSTRADKKMALREIYQWIENNFSYYRHHKKTGWKNSIRHSLSLGDVFVRKKVKHRGQFGTSYWALDLDKLLAKSARCMTRSNVPEFTAVPNGSKNVDQMPSTTDPVVGKRRRAWLDCKQPSKQLKNCRLLHSAMLLKEGFATGFDAATNSLPTEGVISAADLKLDSRSAGADGRLLVTETAAVSADSTTGEVLAVKCASELLRSCSDRGARQTDISGLKVCRRRKQELKVLRLPPEMDDCDQLNFDEEVTPTDGNKGGDTEPGKSLVGDGVFWMEMPEGDGPTPISMDDEEDIGSLLFVPSKTTSNCQRQNVLWTASVRDRPPSPAAFDASLPASPFGFESGLAATDFDGTRDGRAPVPTASDGSSVNVHSIPRWLSSDCYGGGCFSTADDRLDSPVFCNLLSEEVTNMYDESDPDFTDGLFSFSHCL